MYRLLLAVVCVFFFKKYCYAKTQVGGHPVTIQQQQQKCGIQRNFFYEFIQDSFDSNKERCNLNVN